ncbi:MAG: AAA family ATPase, partial [Endomicrobium sp.]|nr:AAA family ATPase [Endomicrobium sp.]
MKFPIGIQDFVKLREEGFLYVDKTERIYDLITKAAGPVFLSRPRRFGKSLLCSTLGAIFENKRELFKGLAIDSSDWQWKRYPVVRIDLNPGNYSRGIEELSVTIKSAIESCAVRYDVPFVGETNSNCLSRLIENLHNRYNERVVVIIDEYDKPLLSTIDNPKLNIQLRDALKGFYAVLKSSDEHLKFVFLTGVTKFSKVSIFSDLNNLTDISLSPKYGDLCGITQEELEKNFQDNINEITKNASIKKEDYLEKLRRFYNGYRFSSNPITVYNPFGLLNHFNNEGLFLSYWYETGTPTFLIKLIKNQNIDIINLKKMT